MSSPSPDSAPSSDQDNTNSSSPSSSPSSSNQGNSNSTSPSPPSSPSSQNPPSSDSPPTSDSSSNSPTPPSNSRSPSSSSDSPPSSDKNPPDSEAGDKSKNYSPSGSKGNLNPKSSGGSKSPPPALPGDQKSNGGSSGNSDAIIGAALGAACLLLIIVCLICCRRRKKRKEMYYYDEPKGESAKSGDYKKTGQDHVVRMQQSPNGGGMGPNSGSSGWGAVPPHSADMSSNYSLGPPPPLPPPSPTLSLGLMGGGTFTYEDLAAATENFAEKNLLGQGGFGYVHKGVLPNGKEVAVKSLKAGSGQGEREFQAEIDMLSRVHHRHLVSLNGYCIAGGQRMLVYEFVPNMTLEHHLHEKGLPTMSWRDRMRIAVGSAKGLAYLHEDCHPRIIHRDIKSANVLLDDSFEAKVADFGLAKLTTDNNTHVSTRVMGTFGYLAPEYASSGKLTEKSDVFSFGVMLLELITGKRPVDVLNVMDDSLVDWARPLLSRGLEDGHFEELVDPFLEGNYDQQELSRMAACASASIRHSGKKRPKMSQVVRGLEGDVSLDDFNEAKRGQANVLASPSSSEYDSSTYQADMKRFRQIALASQEFGSSDGGSSQEMSHNRPSIPRNPYG